MTDNTIATGSRPARVVPYAERKPLYAAYQAAREWAEKNGQSYTDDGIIQAAVKAYETAEIERLRSDGRVWSVAPEPDVPAVRDRHDRVWVRTEYSKAPTVWWLGKHGAGIPHSWHELLGGYGPLTAADAAEAVNV